MTKENDDPLLEGRNPRVDRAAFGFFRSINRVGKRLMSKKLKDRFYKHLIDPRI